MPIRNMLVRVAATITIPRVVSMASAVNYGVQVWKVHNGNWSNANNWICTSGSPSFPYYWFAVTPARHGVAHDGWRHTV